jgi:hypothetical protein
MMESHPFTIANGGEEEVRLVVKSAGDWTGKLFELSTKGNSVVEDNGEEEKNVVGLPGRAMKVRCWIEGPYGE